MSADDPNPSAKMPPLRLPVRQELAFLPTPIHPLDRLGAALGDLGPRIWIKRDDQTGLAGGGNKTRKLEYLLADAIARGADTLITAGAIQSNHARQTAAAARACGMEAELLLFEELDDSDYRFSGNLLVDEILGAEVRRIEARDSPPDALLGEASAELRSNGRKPYVIAIGGSTAIGAVGYAQCAREILEDSAALGIKFDSVFHASGSGGTQAGLITGFKGVPDAPAVIGVSVSFSHDELLDMVLPLSQQTGSLLALDVEIAVDDVWIDDTFIGPGYGQPTDEMIEAVELVARTEGILLDPVYTGKAMAGLISYLRSGRLKNARDVLFLHTGGTTGLFGYRSVFQRS
jgi:D-cysteine desulfhydrase family pyridoxal phosphate-dependent enzyme